MFPSGSIREKFPNFPAQLVIAVQVKATEALKSAFARTKKGHRFSCPHTTLGSIPYDARTYALKPGQGMAGLSTVAGRIKVPFAVDTHARKYLASGAICAAGGPLSTGLSCQPLALAMG
ncbi:MAG: hypothetical protein C4337_07065 [Armatimonadota bacterium]